MVLITDERSDMLQDTEIIHAMVMVYYFETRMTAACIAVLVKCVVVTNLLVVCKSKAMICTEETRYVFYR